MDQDEARERELDELEEMMRARAGRMDAATLAEALDARLADSTAEAQARRVRDMEEWFALELDGPAAG